VYTEKEYAKYI